MESKLKYALTDFFGLKLNRTIMIFGNLIVSIMLLTSCNSAQCMKDYYTENKTGLTQIRTLSKALADNYTFEKVTIIKKA
jgi:hypothetical protein